MTTFAPHSALAISGSPSANARSRILAARTLAHLAEQGVRGSLLDLLELPAEALLARQRDPAVNVAPSPFVEDHPLREVIASPEGVRFPPIFLLGSGQLSATIAAERGRGFAAAYFFSPDESETAIRAYKAAFQPSESFAAPHAILTVGVICAESEELADDLSRAAQLTALRRLNGVKGSFASVEEAPDYQFSDEDRVKLRVFRPIAGSPERVQRELSVLVAQIGPDELMITITVGDHGLRLRSYELLAEVFDLASVAAD